MKNKIIVILAFGGLLSACSEPQGETLVNPPEQREVVTQNGGVMDVAAAPRAEIVFVVDDSDSMQKHINEVSASMEEFVHAFADHNPTEYHFAVQSIYDRRTFESKEYLDSFGPKAFSPLGAFHQVKSSASDIVPNKYFISSKDENLKDLLFNTLKLNIVKLKDGGPQTEELFSPIASLYKIENLKSTPESLATQQGFSYGKDSYKIIFLITDAKDDSNISPSQLRDGLIAKSGGDASKVMSFGAIVRSSDGNCQRDPGNKPNPDGSLNNIETFLKDTNPGGTPGSNIASLCEPFGKKFAEFGKSIRARAFTKVLKLSHGIPSMSNEKCIAGQPNNRLCVFYGHQEIQLESITKPGVKGYTVDADNREVHINPDVQLEPEEGATFYTQYIGVSSGSIRKGLITPYDE